MKKYILSVAIIALLVSSCDSVEDINNEIDKQNAIKEELVLKNLEREAIPTSGTYSLTEEDYDVMGTDWGEPGKFDNFSDEVDPTEFIPTFLYEKYYILTEETSVKVTYNFYNSSVKTDFDVTPYIMTGEDYDLFGTDWGQPGKFNNFSSRDDHTPEEFIKVLLMEKNELPFEGDKELVEYKFYRTFTEDRLQEYKFDGTNWVKTEKTDGFEDIYTLIDEDYNSMGEGDDEPGKYDNFSKDTNPEDYLPEFLKEQNPDAVNEDVISIEFKYYTNTIDTKAAYFEFNGASWNTVENVTTKEKTEDSGDWILTHKVPSYTEAVSVDYTFTITTQNEGIWKADPSIKLELSDADYEVTGDSQYKNFDLRGEADIETFVLDKVSTILEANYASKIKQGVIFTITYKYYDGSNGLGIIRVTKDGSAWKVVAEDA